LLAERLPGGALTIHSELDANILAARAQLLALRASLPEGIKVRPDHIRVAPDSPWLTEAEAAAILAARSKPIRCTATLEDGNLSVSAEAPTADWARILAMSNRVETLDPANRDRTSSDAVILLKGRDESLHLPGPAYQAWRRDYLQPDHCGLGGGPPTDAERSTGITFVWQASRTEPIIEAYSLTADSSVLCERCGARLATALFRNRDVEPPVKLLLCGECIDTENGRKLVNIMNESAVPPPFPDKMTDEELRSFFRNFPLAPFSDDP
jgi:hypothetical protein